MNDTNVSNVTRKDNRMSTKHYIEKSVQHESS